MPACGVLVKALIRRSGSRCGPVLLQVGHIEDVVVDGAARGQNLGKR